MVEGGGMAAYTYWIVVCYSHSELMLLHLFYDTSWLNVQLCVSFI